MHQRDHDIVLHEHVVHLLGQLRTFLEHGGLSHFGEQCLVFLIAPTGDVVAQPLIVRARDLLTPPVAQVGLRVCPVIVVGVHLDVGVELAVGVRAGRVAAEEDGGVDVAQLGLHADLLPPLLDQRLGALAHRVGGGLVEDAQAHAVLLADAVGPPDPAGLIQDLVRLLDVLGQALVVRC